VDKIEERMKPYSTPTSTLKEGKEKLF